VKATGASPVADDDNSGRDIGRMQGGSPRPAGGIMTGPGLATREIAATHLFLMENRFVTGTVLTVDGGSVLTGN
jgi:NAD(P)-dependent dehydrogenase (short-subunit alcohol dehydrogenase family)